ncbi:hypothetical protein SNEBB_007592 [Seison nebaliae]|nr:hypothetical protein SNEBB_007592 [Seison nebaliae]
MELNKILNDLKEKLKKGNSNGDVINVNSVLDVDSIWKNLVKVDDEEYLANETVVQIRCNEMIQYVMHGLLSCQLRQVLSDELNGDCKNLISFVGSMEYIIKFMNAFIHPLPPRKRSTIVEFPSNQIDGTILNSINPSLISLTEEKRNTFNQSDEILNVDNFQLIQIFSKEYETYTNLLRTATKTMIDHYEQSMKKVDLFLQQSILNYGKFYINNSSLCKLNFKKVFRKKIVTEHINESKFIFHNLLTLKKLCEGNISKTCNVMKELKGILMEIYCTNRINSINKQLQAFQDYINNLKENEIFDIISIQPNQYFLLSDEKHEKFQKDILKNFLNIIYVKFLFSFEIWLFNYLSLNDTYEEDEKYLLKIFNDLISQMPLLYIRNDNGNTFPEMLLLVLTFEKVDRFNENEGCTQCYENLIEMINIIKLREKVNFKNYLKTLPKLVKNLYESFDNLLNILYVGEMIVNNRYNEFNDKSNYFPLIANNLSTIIKLLKEKMEMMTSGKLDGKGKIRLFLNKEFMTILRSVTLLRKLISSSDKLKKMSLEEIAKKERIRREVLVKLNCYENFQYIILEITEKFYELYKTTFWQALIPFHSIKDLPSKKLHNCLCEIKNLHKKLKFDKEENEWLLVRLCSDINGPLFHLKKYYNENSSDKKMKKCIEILSFDFNFSDF